VGRNEDRYPFHGTFDEVWHNKFWGVKNTNYYIELMDSESSALLSLFMQTSVNPDVLTGRLVRARSQAAENFGISFPVQDLLRIHHILECNFFFFPRYGTKSHTVAHYCQRNIPM